MRKDIFRKGIVIGILLLIGLFPSINGLPRENRIISDIDNVQNNTISEGNYIDSPPSFDLRNVNGTSYVTLVRNQQGGTCWCHATMASMESNLLMTGNWNAAGESGEPNLAEYHLDWWNGFNLFYNEDDPSSGGLPVHGGGDFLVASAYLSRGDGAVRDIDGQSYNNPPARYESSYHIYSPLNIEWYVAGTDLSNINIIKEKIMSHGAIATYHCTQEDYSHDYGDYLAFYQPPLTPDDKPHNVAIIGWDNDKETPAPSPGAWLCKDSHPDDYPYEGYYWISYYDKWCCQHSEQGAVSFQDVEPLVYNHIYYHDYHGWRDIMPNVYEAFNAFAATNDERLEAVSFFTVENNVDYQLKIYSRFEDGNLQNELFTISGIIPFKGFHTFNLDSPIELQTGDEFYIYLSVSSGGQAIDRSSYVSPRFRGKSGGMINSSANPKESYYRVGTTWLDLYDYSFSNPAWDHSANFCIKGLCKFTGPKPLIHCEGRPYWDDVIPGDTVTGQFKITNKGDSGTFLNWAIVEWPDCGTWSFNPPSGRNLPIGVWVNVTVTVVAPDKQNYRCSGNVKVQNTEYPNDYCKIPVVLYTPFNKQSMNSPSFLKNLFFQKFLRLVQFAEIYRENYNGLKTNFWSI